MQKQDEFVLTPEGYTVVVYAPEHHPARVQQELAHQGALLRQLMEEDAGEERPDQTGMMD